MIKLDVEEYCQQCLDFSPDVTKPERLEFVGYDSTKTVYSDTIIQCKYRKRCSGITRYLEHQIKERVNE